MALPQHDLRRKVLVVGLVDAIRELDSSDFDDDNSIALPKLRVLVQSVSLIEEGTDERVTTRSVTRCVEFSRHALASTLDQLVG
jgi:hypothetical protein